MHKTSVSKKQGVQAELGRKILKMVLSKDVNALHGKPGGLSHLAVHGHTGQSNFILVQCYNGRRGLISE